MSDSIKHECGIAMLRLLKPLDYYEKKYGNKFWALNRMYLLMEKQHNRGQDGAGLTSIKFKVNQGEQYIHISKSNSSKPIQDVFAKAFNNDDYLGELFLGHLRYGTFGKNDLDYLHPFLRESNWRSRSLVLAGNFNLTNMDELIDKLIDLGQHPVKVADTAILLEKLGSFVDREVEKLFQNYKLEGYNNNEISPLIEENINIPNLLKRASKNWDGGFVIGGMMGHGDAFVLRDANGIRPCYYYYDDEIAVITSERPVIQTTFNIPFRNVKELEPGNAIIIKKTGKISIERIFEPLENPKKCSFERIYFSRGTDADIYKERKALGRGLRDSVLKSIDYDLKRTVFSYIPNTASVAFQGLAQSLSKWVDDKRMEEILIHRNEITPELLNDIFSNSLRREYIAVKDVKMRTFITNAKDRDDMVAHVYDITYGQVRNLEDNLVVLDDSIVRGTTLRRSIIRILDRLHPKKIVIASSAPQIRYPDCYGIDMSILGDFIAFNAAVQLLKERGMEGLLYNVYQKCKASLSLPKEEIINHVKEIYSPFTYDEITKKISELITPEDSVAEVEVVFQTIEGLHNACPNHKGDWYFTGDYPTFGGNKVVNKSFINYFEGVNQRAY
ncbi:MAG: amidophosphoribosyltransferase [Bacteroidales bacterium]|nr:amidophosphoribosyltransferase [Bacteroidales bacterium]